MLAGEEPGVLLLGPAGSGKTVLAARVAAGGRTAWARLAPGYDGAADLVGIAAASVGADIVTAGASLLDLSGELLGLLETEPTPAGARSATRSWPRCCRSCRPGARS
jgi:SpoVK/Ycf46/Vps4 family AAA+-type ATPase